MIAKSRNWIAQVLFFFILSLHPYFFTVEASEPDAAKSDPFVATFSICARDPVTGELGVAVQSKIVGVGAIVPFGAAEVGVIATQALANVQYGPVGLALLRSGKTARETADTLLSFDPAKENRQFGILAADGTAVNFTGKKCLDWAGAVSGENYTIQGNILAGEAVVLEMEKAFLASKGVLAERLIAALQAGQTAGGDKRGMQSAALLIVRKGWGYGGLTDRFRDIRVDEHEQPIKELERVYLAHRKLFPRPS